VKRHEIDESILRYLIDNYQPTIDCLEAMGECDFRCGLSDSKCPCAKVIELRNRIGDEDSTLEANQNERL
jgi:hypothetical protein